MKFISSSIARLKKEKDKELKHYLWLLKMCVRVVGCPMLTPLLWKSILVFNSLLGKHKIGACRLVPILSPEKFVKEEK